MNKELFLNEIIYQMSIQTANAMLEKQLISKSEFNRIKLNLIEKYKPTIPMLMEK